ncbi:MAG TPA: aminotransferase class V-fold PLP-dependent enzyme, partial [bacterium]|nr:aminotransferase class V-fold PLP-dependent enzyme [bacterium]
MKKPIYLDHHATTPLDPRVLQKMMPYLTEHYGNAASRTHQYGWIAEEAVEQARIRIATAIGASKDEIVFTSGATEANNLAIKGIAETFQRKGRHIITVSTEHASVLDTCEYLREAGFEITVLEVSEDGILDQIKILNAIRSDTILVSVMLANNETGVIQDMAAIGAITREKGIILHTDAVQALGKIPVHVENLNVD